MENILNLFNILDKTKERLDAIKRKIDDLVDLLSKAEKKILFYIQNSVINSREDEREMFRIYLKNSKVISIPKTEVINDYNRMILRLYKLGIINKVKMIFDKGIWKKLNLSENELIKLRNNEITIEEIIRNRDNYNKITLTYVGQRILSWVNKEYYIDFSISDLIDI